MLIDASRVSFLVYWSDVSGCLPQETRSVIIKLFIMGWEIFVLGFFIWNLDNIFCDTLTRWKVAIGWPIAFLLEGTIFSSSTTMPS